MNAGTEDASTGKAPQKTPAPNPIKPLTLKNVFSDKPPVQKKSFMQSKGSKGGGGIRQMRSQRGR
ncbi:MAG: hypothetical protein WCN98_18970 [Verrucomicrobiaceae bacterium]